MIVFINHQGKKCDDRAVKGRSVFRDGHLSSLKIRKMMEQGLIEHFRKIILYLLR